jgi:hypothetical protein
MVLGFELRTSHLLIRCSINWSSSQPFFCFSYFSGRVSCFCLRLVSDFDPPTYGLPCGWDHRHMLPYLAYWLRKSLTNFLPRLAFNWDLTDLCLLSGWDYRCESICPAVSPVLALCILNVYLMHTHLGLLDLIDECPFCHDEVSAFTLSRTPWLEVYFI